MLGARVLTSIAAGLVMPVVTLLLNRAAGGFAGLFDSRALIILYLTAIFLIMLGVAMWRKISPPIFGSTLFVAFVGLPYMLVAVTHSVWGNLGGFAVFIAACVGALIGVAVAVFGAVLQQFRLPGWAPVLTAAAGVFISVTSQAWTGGQTREQSARIIDRLEEIRRAELAHALAASDGTFTCNGAELHGVSNIQWGPNLPLGLQDSNQGLSEGHWIHLECVPLLHPSTFTIVAGAMGGGDLLRLDSTGRLTKTRAGR